MTKQIHLAAHFPGVNNATAWSDPAAGSLGWPGETRATRAAS